MINEPQSGIQWCTSRTHNKTDQKLVEKKKQEEIKLKVKKKMSDRKNKIDKLLVRWGVERKKRSQTKPKMNANRQNRNTKGR